MGLIGEQGGEHQAALVAEQGAAGIEPLQALLLQGGSSDHGGADTELGAPLHFCHLMSDQWQLGRGTGRQQTQLGALILCTLNRNAPVERAGERGQQQQRKATSLQGEATSQLQRIRWKWRD